MKRQKILERFEEIHNRLSDKSMIWWPFVFLKPRDQREFLRTRKILLMTLLFGLWGGFLNLLITQPALASLGPSQALKTLSYYWLGFLFWFTFVTSYFWNRRAERMVLSVEEERRRR
jgi:hypothetical protein